MLEWFSPKFEFTIILEIGNQKTRVQIPLETYPHSIDAYELKATKFISSVSLTGIWNPKLALRWPEFSLHHKYAALTFLLPESTTIPWIKSRQLKRILSKPHYILAFYTDPKGRLVLLPLKRSLWSNQPPNYAQSTTATIRLYPALPSGSGEMV